MARLLVSQTYLANTHINILYIKFRTSEFNKNGNLYYHKCLVCNLCVVCMHNVYIDIFIHVYIQSSNGVSEVIF